jgi:ribonuclease Y
MQIGWTWTLLLAALALLLGLAAGYLLALQLVLPRLRREAHAEGRREVEEEYAREGKSLAADRERIAAQARTEAEAIRLAAHEEALRLRDEAEAELKRRRHELQREEERLGKRREDLDKRIERFEQREQQLNKRQSALDKRQNDVEKIEAQRTAELERVSGLSREEARGQLLEAVEKETREDMARRIREVEVEIKDTADARAREIVAEAIQRVASDHVADVSVSVVPLPSDEMKGRIIGRSGRNIRAFEQSAGVDLVVDDTPEAVTISSFDPVRRAVAKLALEKLVLDGRIHPARIEKVVEDARGEIERVIREEGERAAFEASVPGLHPEILKLLGRLRFRTSYGQNQHAHAIETAQIASIIATEIGADVAIARAGGLLHDLGKAIDHEFEGTHAQLGAEVLRRFGVSQRIINCVASHHHEVDQESIEAVIVESADAISGARPGARRESLEIYVKRVKALEEIAQSFPGVQASYALQAGREIRVIVEPERIDDLAAMRLAKSIAGKIEETMQYPGQIKVTVLRETRAIDYAK